MASTSTSLGKRLRSRRVALGLTLADASARAGLSLPYVSNLERGRGNPTIDALRSLADALDLEVGELVGGDGSGEALDTSSLVLADAPPSLGEFTRSGRFEAVARRLAVHQGLSLDEMRTKLMVGMASAPRRSQGEPTSEDWRRLLDVYSVILADE
ncbi:MAG: helix-turn-helix transcriptional regulator [Candidatus Microthrix sp.]|jgi:transcriptional regulator with XRE-family HTH domain|nr:helix-turn-helix transcriptional regulator [Candidatus Microthrix sp.]MBK6311719.1 helix-turn-helix transcriptional regulator [Candidatus Microthrix sp.]MBK6437901.1 helix-turn-helix transcriptional regulator [Candidatus Microthrix sp.]MBK7164301.1 helix-turn-helix transcriptional regulator [Candidatus Microthrix sp.]